MLRLKIDFISFFFVLLFGFCQNPPQISATGNQIFCGNAPMLIVTEISISDGDGALDIIYVQISTGYTIGSDFLFLEGVHPNISASWSIGEGQLTLRGPAADSEFETAINDIRFQTS